MQSIGAVTWSKYGPDDPFREVLHGWPQSRKMALRYVLSYPPGFGGLWLSYIRVSLISSRGLFRKENEDAIHTIKHVISNPIHIVKFFSLFRIFSISRILWQDVFTTEIIRIILISTMTTNAKSKSHCTHDYHFYFIIIIINCKLPIKGFINTNKKHIKLTVKINHNRVTLP